MTPTSLENLKAEVYEHVCTYQEGNEIESVGDQIINYLSTTHRLIDLEKVEGMRKTKTPYLQDHGFNAALSAVIAMVKGEK